MNSSLARNPPKSSNNKGPLWNGYIFIPTDRTTTSIRTSTPPTTTIHTLYHLPSSSSCCCCCPILTITSTSSSNLPLPPLQRRLGHATDTRAAEIRLLGLDALDTAQLLVALLLPLGDQRGVGVVVLDQVLVQWFRDGGFRVVQLVDVAGAWKGGRGGQQQSR